MLTSEFTGCMRKSEPISYSQVSNMNKWNDKFCIKHFSTYFVCRFSCRVILIISITFRYYCYTEKLGSVVLIIKFCFNFWYFQGIKFIFLQKVCSPVCYVVCINNNVWGEFFFSSFNRVKNPLQIPYGHFLWPYNVYLFYTSG